MLLGCSNGGVDVNSDEVSLNSLHEAQVHKRDKTSPIENTRVLQALKNPYRGFRYETIFLVQPDGRVVNAWDRSEVINVQEKIDLLKASFGSTDEHIRLSQLYIYLTDFVGGDISPAALATIQSIFDTYKVNNLQALLRWVYDYDGTPDSKNTGISNVSLPDIKRHLEQLTPIVRNTDGVISHMNGGVLGLWGEWHNRSLSLLSDQAKLDEMFTEILDNHLPSYMSTQVRLATFKANRTLPANMLERIGFHNDFFTAASHPLALGNDYVPGTKLYQTVKAQSPYAVVDGEMPYDGTTEWHMTYAIDPYETLKIFNEHHYNSFSVVHSYENNINQWKNIILDKAKLSTDAGGIRFHQNYFTENGTDTDRTMYEFVRDHLGYRLYADVKSSTASQKGNVISYAVDMYNYGFSRPYTNNAIKVVLLDSANNIVSQAENMTDMRQWQPFDPKGDPMVTLAHTLKGKMNVPDIQLKTFKLGLYMPSKSIGFEENHEFSIKLANKNNRLKTLSGQEIFVFYDSALSD